MADEKFFIKIRHFKEALSKMLWKSGLQLSREEVAAGLAFRKRQGYEQRAPAPRRPLSLRLEV